jgi:hypothetical protein
MYLLLKKIRKIKLKNITKKITIFKDLVSNLKLFFSDISLTIEL